MASSTVSWRCLACSVKELRLDITLACGQSFRWRELSPGEWTSVLCGRIWTLKQNNDSIMYKVTEPDQPTATMHMPDTKGSANSKSQSESNYEAKDVKIKEEKHDPTCDTDNRVCEGILKDYFQLKYNLVDLYAQWSEADDNFRKVASTFSGVRILRQDPVENLFSFICSSNNHISRIGSMVERMCEAYGERVAELDGHAYHAFPTVENLAGEGVEEKLRELGFGYRARYISQSARMIHDRSDAWLYSLRKLPYDETKAELMTLCGVGAKVADCVCLMSMDQLGAIPVDTHVWQIAARDYMPKLNSAKSLTPTIYKQIGDHFRSLWGELAGWTHSVLFSADLKKFQDLKPNVKKSKPGKQILKAEDKDMKPVKLEVTSPSKRSQAPGKPKRTKRIKR